MGHYVIRVKGTLSPELTDAFPSLTVDPECAQTVLHGDLEDQSALAGILNHLNMLGVDIIEIVQLPPSSPQAASDTSPPHPTTDGHHS